MMRNCTIGSDDGEFGVFSTLSTKQVTLVKLLDWQEREKMLQIHILR